MVDHMSTVRYRLIRNEMANCIDRFERLSSDVDRGLRLLDQIKILFHCSDCSDCSIVRLQSHNPNNLNNRTIIQS